MEIPQTTADLAPLIRNSAHAVLRDWRVAVRQLQVASHLDTPTLNDHVPNLLEELACELEGRNSQPVVVSVQGSPVMHGLDRLRLGFDIEEVVAEYSALREVLCDLMIRSGHAYESDVHRVIHRVLDSTIGLAVKTYAHQKAREVQLQREEYLSFVAHDLRTPLSSIAMGISLIERNYTGASESESLFKAVHRSVARLKSMVVKVVQEENDAGRPAARLPIALQPVVQACLDDLSPIALFKGVTLVNQVQADLICEADTVLLAQILQNLVSNAITYSPGGEVKVGACPLSDGTECWVSDNGQGIPADRLDHVFAKWETNAGKGEGMGLGLNIVRHYVEAHGGQVLVKSDPGEGATFTFTLRNDPLRVLQKVS